MRKRGLSPSIVAEYETVVGSISGHSSPGELIAALVSQCDWTQDGAEILVALARRYGTFVLRNALALAAALDIEDGEAGL